jgi:hypothetical protein
MSACLRAVDVVRDRNRAYERGNHAPFVHNLAFQSGLIGNRILQPVFEGTLDPKLRRVC